MVDDGWFSGRMKRIVVALLSVSLLAACGSDSKKSAPTESVPDGGSVPSSDGGPVADGSVDPSVTEGCSILTQEQMASIFGEAEGQWNSNAANADELAECQWYTADGRSIAFQIFMLDLPEDNLPTDGEPVAVGNGGYYRESGGIPSLDVDIRGWWVRSVGVQGTVTREQVIALAELLNSVLIERSASTVGGASGGDGGEGAVGTLTDMSVTIDAPANLAGTMTLADLQAQATSLALCGGPWTLNSIGKIFTVIYEFGVMTGAATSPAPVVGLSLEVQGDYTGPGVYVAKMRFATNTDEVNGVGSMTVNPGELTGSFTFSDASGTITGSWMCAGS